MLMNEIESILMNEIEIMLMNEIEWHLRMPFVLSWVHQFSIGIHKKSEFTTNRRASFHKSILFVLGDPDRMFNLID
jgi:hypothetical protein